MFDLSWAECVVIGVVAIWLIGPEELPHVMRAVGRVFGRLRTAWRQVSRPFQDVMEAADEIQTPPAATRRIRGDDGQWYDAYETDHQAHGDAQGLSRPDA